MLEENYKKALNAIKEVTKRSRLHFIYEFRLNDLYFGNYYAKRIFYNAYLEAIEKGLD